MDTCNNIVWEGYDEFEVPTPRLSVPTGGDQTANVVVTGDSSGIVFQNCDIGPGAGVYWYDTKTSTPEIERLLQLSAIDCSIQQRVPEMELKTWKPEHSKRRT